MSPPFLLNATTIDLWPKEFSPSQDDPEVRIELSNATNIIDNVELTKKFYWKPISLVGPDWKTEITDLSLQIRQDSQNVVSGIIFFNYSSMIRAAFDPDVWFRFHLLNNADALIGVIAFDWWRVCGNINVNVPFQPTQISNLDAVQNTVSVSLDPRHRHQVKWC